MKVKRDFAGHIELRDGDGELPDIVGLAAPFYSPEDRGTEYQLWDGAVERIMPSAFDSALNEGSDVYASFNHDANNVLGRVAASTLRLSKTDDGLVYSIRANDKSPFYRDMVSRIERRDVVGSSITFSVRAAGVEWVKPDEGPEIRELHSVQLFELGPVVSPAYAATAAGLRNAEQLAEARQSYEQWQATQEPVKRRLARHWLDTVLTQ